jgi:hypothetical protein
MSVTNDAPLGARFSVAGELRTGIGEVGKRSTWFYPGMVFGGQVRINDLRVGSTDKVGK